MDHGRFHVRWLCGIRMLYPMLNSQSFGAEKGAPTPIEMRLQAGDFCGEKDWDGSCAGVGWRTAFNLDAHDITSQSRPWMVQRLPDARHAVRERSHAGVVVTRPSSRDLGEVPPFDSIRFCIGFTMQGDIR